MHIHEEKENLRKAIEERLKGVNTESRSAESRSLCRRLTEEIPMGTVVCAFFPMRSEPDITPFLQEVLHRGDPLYLPCFEGALVYRKVEDLTALVRGKLGTMEPPPDAPLLEFHEETKKRRNEETNTSYSANHATSATTVILVPGRAFDAKGHRLGRGNGGYDLWLSQNAKHGATIIGVALECQLVDTIPMESHDVSMDAVATARGITTIEC